MKLTTVLLFITLVHVSASSLAQRLTFVKNNATLKQVFNEVYKQTGYSIFSTGASAKSDRRINADFENASLDEVLKKVFENQPFNYVIQDKIIVIQDAKNFPKISLLAVVDTSFIINGRIINESGQSLAGANIKLIVPNKASVTIASHGDGTFKLSGGKGSRLIVSYIGYEDSTFFIKKGNLGDIKMQPRTNKLSEVVTIGYGKTTKILNPGSVVVITSADIEKQPIVNVLQALQGLVPGLVVTQTSGFASAPFDITIRGQNSLASAPTNGVNKLSEPFYILDGVPIISAGSSSNQNVGINKNDISGPTNGQSPLYGINPADIESISILKDADATAIYGARGANGVILITTKKGKAGKTIVNANVYSGLSLQTRTLDLMNTQEYLAMRKRAFLNDSIAPSKGNAYDLLNWDQNRYTNWQKQILGTAHTTDAELTLSGGDKNTTFRLSGGFNSSSPPFQGNFKEQRESGSFALTNNAFGNKLITTATLNFSSTNSTLPQQDLTSLIFLAPNAPSLLDSQGNLNYAGWNSTAGTYSFPFAATSLKRNYVANTKNFIGNLTLKYHIITGLDFNTSFGYNISRQNQLLESPTTSINPATTASPFSQFGNNNSESWIVEPNLTYSKTIGKHYFSTLIGSTFQDTKVDGNNIIATGYADDAFLGTLAGASSYQIFSNDAETKFQSLYARINYNYEEKYVLDLNGRRDGSSRFAPDRKFGNFGSIAGAWIFSREQFVGDALNFLSLGKLRASYGVVGSDDIPDYQYLSTFGLSQSTYQNTRAYQLSRLPNAVFGWSTNKKLEAALSLGFLNGRINGEFAWYRNHSGNQLVSYPLPALAGFTSIAANLPAVVQNQGIEFTLQTQNIKTKNISWNTSFNISRNNNKLLSFPGLDNSSYFGRYAIGRSISSLGMYSYTGVNPANGQYTFQDANRDGQVDYFGRTDYIYKDPSPAYFGGLSNNFSYKDFSLSVLFSFTKQMGVLRLSNVAPGGLGGGLGNQLILSKQSSGKSPLENLTTNPYRPDLQDYYASDAVFVDASYIRLQNLSMTYSLPSSLLGKAGMTNLKIYAQCQNLLTITGYKGTDPASPGSFSLPPRKIVTAGIQITF